jgi:hypothetical protein
MKLEEAKEFSLKKMICKQSQIPFLRLLDKIYDDFKLELEAEYKRGWKDRHTQSDLENRTCESCKHCLKDMICEGSRECEEGVSFIQSESFYLVEGTDGCNRWEQK